MEMALVVPLFLALVLGIVSTGIVYNHKLDLVHAAREGARYGATVPVQQCVPTHEVLREDLGTARPDRGGATVRR